MVQFTTIIHRFEEKQGEKTGWTYIHITEDIARQLKPGNKKSFRVKGKLDAWAFEGIAVMPMGDGSFIMALNADARKGIGKKKGAMVKAVLSVDEKEPEINAEFLECLADEPAALAYFNTLTKGHRLYFSRWIDSAKTLPTRTKRMAMAVSGLARKMGYPEMIRDAKVKKDNG